MEISPAITLFVIINILVYLSVHVASRFCIRQHRDNGTFPSSQKVLLGSTALEYFHAALSWFIFVRKCGYLNLMGHNGP